MFLILHTLLEVKSRCIKLSGGKWLFGAYRCYHGRSSLMCSSIRRVLQGAQKYSLLLNSKQSLSWEARPFCCQKTESFYLFLFFVFMPLRWSRKQTKQHFGWVFFSEAHYKAVNTKPSIWRGGPTAVCLQQYKLLLLTWQRVQAAWSTKFLQGY